MSRARFVTVIFMALMFVVSSCSPPEVEGAKVHLKNKRFDDALAQLEKAVNLYPDNAEAWYLYGEVNGQLKNYDKMIEAFKKVEELGNQFADKIKNDRQRFFAQSYNDGVKDYQNYPKIRETDPEKARKVMESAINNFRVANEINPTYQAARMVGICYQILDEKDNAIKAYSNLIESYPDSAEAYSDLGSLYFFTQKYDKAIEALNKSVALDSNNATAYTLLAQTYDFKKDTKNAIVAYRKAIKLNPEEKALPFNLGLLLVNTANSEGTSPEDKKVLLNESIEYFNMVLEMDPEFKEAYQLKGQSELLLEKYEDARDTLSEGVEYFPDDANMWYNLGVAYAHTNQKKKAEKAFAKAEELGN